MWWTGALLQISQLPPARDLTSGVMASISAWYVLARSVRWRVKWVRFIGVRCRGMAVRFTIRDPGRSEQPSPRGRTQWLLRTSRRQPLPQTQQEDASSNQAQPSFEEGDRVEACESKRGRVGMRNHRGRTGQR